MTHNGTRPTPRRESDVQRRIVLALSACLALAVALAVVGLREPLLVSRIVLFVFALIASVAPFALLAAGRRRDMKERAQKADAAAKRQAQTRREIRRMVTANVETLRARLAANDDAEARRSAIRQFAAEDILPNASHAIAATERDLWMQEIEALADVLIGHAPQLMLDFVEPEQKSA